MPKSSKTPSPVCALCGGRLKQTAFTYFHPWNGELYEFENVPVKQCRQCGEIWLDEKISQAIDAVVKQRPKPKRYHKVPVFSLPKLSEPTV